MGAIASPPLICCYAPHIYCYAPVGFWLCDMMDGWTLKATHGGKGKFFR